MNFAQAVLIHDLTTQVDVTRLTVECKPAHRFSLEIKSLARALENFSEDEFWSNFIRRCRRLLRDVSLTPLSPSSPALELDSSVGYFIRLIDGVSASYPPGVVDGAWACVNALHDLAQNTANQLGAAVTESLTEGSPSLTALVTKTRQIDESRGWLAGVVPGAYLLTEADLRVSPKLERLVVLGPSCWFPAHFISAPRANKICYVHYDFYTDRSPQVSIFAASQWSLHAAMDFSAPRPGDFSNKVDAMALIPTIDWEALARASGGSRESDDRAPELIPANLFLLADGFSTFLEADEGPRIDAVHDLSFGGQARLKATPTRSVQPGDFIVLRSEGKSGDYIPEIADGLLGAKASRLRAMQAEWKLRLSDMVRERGFAEVERDLRKLGVESPNLHYRLWKYSMRTQDPNHFRILMRYVGLGSRADEIWIAMSELHEAHHGAGQDVRRLLEEEVVAADTDRLLASGRVDVRLRDIDAGALSVFRVEARSPEIVAVKEDQLREIRKVDDDLWPG